MNEPLQSGNPWHAVAAAMLAVRAPISTVANPSTAAPSVARDGPTREGGASGVERAATSSAASSSIAVPRCRMIVHAGSSSFTVIAPSRI